MLEDVQFVLQVNTKRQLALLDVAAVQQDITVPREQLVFTAVQQGHIQQEVQEVAPVVQLVNIKDLVNKDPA